MKIAVIGSGISGLGAAWLLSQRHEVTLLERQPRSGGHSNTVVAETVDGPVPVDTGFIVYNERTYPNLIGMLDHLGVKRTKTDMSFAVSLDGGRMEYGGSTLRTLFAQKRNFFSPRFHGMVRDILRFFRQASSDLASGRCEGVSLEEYLKSRGYADAFLEDHLLPMAAAVWSCPVSTMVRFPASSFVRFFDNHGLLQVEGRPQWWTVDGGSRCYIDALMKRLEPCIETGNGAMSVWREQDGVHVVTADGQQRCFDRVVMACHGDEAHGLLSDKDQREADILGSFAYQPNRAILHRDPAQMPSLKRVWSCWNYLGTKDDAAGRQVAVTYWMNSLQALPTDDPLFVTLNPFDEIPEDKVIASIDYEHPVFDESAVSAQSRLPEIQGMGGVWYCGSYCGYGFHEDGLASAVAVARALGVAAPWGHHPVHAMQAVGDAMDPAFCDAGLAA